MNTRIELKPLGCPRPGCGGVLDVLYNGGGIYFRCQEDPPRCGLIIPAETARAWAVENAPDEREPRAEDLPLARVRRMPWDPLPEGTSAVAPP